MKSIATRCSIAAVALCAVNPAAFCQARAPKTKPATADSGLIIPIRDSADIPGTGFSVQYEFAKGNQTTRTIGQIQPDGNLIIPKSEIPPIKWNDNNTTFTFSVTEPTSGTRAQYSYYGLSGYTYSDSSRQPFLTDWNQPPEGYSIFSGIITDEAGAPLPNCSFEIKKDDGMVVYSDSGLGLPRSHIYFTGPTGEFRLAFFLDAQSAFMFQRGYFLKTDAVPNQSFQLIPGQYHEISPRAVKPFEVILLDENDKPISPLAFSAAPLANARATQLTNGNSHYRLYPQPGSDSQPTRYIIRDMPIPSSLEISAFDRIFEQKAVRKTDSSITLKSRPLDFSLRGKVVDVYNQPVPNAAVSFFLSGYPRDNFFSKVRTQTDSNGMYQLKSNYASMRSGLTAEAEGFGRTISSPFGYVYNPVQMDGRLEGEVAGPTLVIARISTATVHLKNLHKWSANYDKIIASRSPRPEDYFQSRGFDEKPFAFNANISSPQIMTRFGNGGSLIAQWEAEMDRKGSTLSVSVPAETTFTIYLIKNSSDPQYTAKSLGPFSPGESVDITDELRSTILF